MKEARGCGGGKEMGERIKSQKKKLRVRES